MLKKPAAALALALALTSCAGNDDTTTAGNDGPDSTAATASPTPEPTPEPTQDVAADQKIVDAAVLTLRDVPAGWTSKPPEDDDDDSGKAKIAKCVGHDYDELYNDAYPTAESDTFISPNDNEMSVEVGLAPTEEWLVNAFEITRSTRFRDCLLKNLEAELQSNGDVEVGDLSVNEMSFNPIGDDVMAFRVNMPLSAEGFTITAVADFVLVRVDRGQVAFTAFSLDSPMPVEDLERYTTVSVNRLGTGLDDAA